jgi:hypothetical protein
MQVNAPIGAAVSAAAGVMASLLWLVPQTAASAAPAARPPPTVAAPLPSERTPETPLEIAVISDLNQSYGSTHYGREVHAAVSALTDRLRPELVLITGDMVAGQRADVDPPAMWQGFHRAVRAPLRRAGILLAPTPGNHDASPTFTRERAEYVQQWRASESGLRFIDGAHYPLRYTFEFRGAFFMSLDAAAVGPLSNEQRAWVEQQLDRAIDYRVKIAFGHLPLHPIAHGREYEILNDSKLEALFTRHGVDAYASGHQHAYYPGWAGDMHHVAMPCLGAGARPLIGTRAASAQALVLLRVEDGGVSSLEAFHAPSFTKPIARSTLPPQIALGRHQLVRDDLVAPRIARAR